MKMKVSLDDGETFQTPDNVIVVYEDVDVPGEDATGELHVKLTHEGIIKDVWASRESSLDHNIATSSVLIDDLLDDMIDTDK